MKTATRAAALALLMLLFGACSRESERPLRIGITAWPGYEYLHLAREKGFFEAEGVAVRLVEFSSLRDERRAFDRGHLDGGALTLMEAMHTRREAGPGLKVVLVIDFSNGADLLLARSDIVDVPSLRGRRVGVELGSLGMYMLTRALELNHMTTDDVQMIATHQTDMQRVYAQGAVDAVVSYPPVSTALERDHSAQRIFTSASIPGEIVDVLAFDAATLEQRPDDVAAVVRGFYRAVRYAQEHPDEAAAIMAARERISAAELQAAFAGGIQLVKLEEQASYLASEGRLAPVIAGVAGVLRRSGKITVPDNYAGLLDAAPAAAAGRSQ
jgi:NitT/TauT family transport system substrate-binding protein